MADIYWENMMKEIPLTQGMVALVDDDWYEYLMQWEWRYSKPKASNTGYAARHEGKNPHRKTIYMHRVIMNTLAGMEVNHGDFNGCNNQTYNLENVTHIENQRHQSMHKNNTSGYIGVGKNHNKWRAYIMAYGQSHHLGTFDAPEGAAQAYDVAAIQYFGRHAVLNFPDEHLAEFS